MSGVTGAVVGSAVVGAGASVYGANKAAKATGKAADAANAEQARQFDLVREDTAALRGLGNSAIGRINKLYGYAPASQPLSYEEWLGQQKTHDVSIPRNLSGADGRYGRVFGPVVAGQMANTATRAQYDAYVKGFKPQSPAGPDMSVFFESPDYQFNLAEGEKANDRLFAARGRYDSGAAIKGGLRYASGLASREFASFYDRLAQQAGLGTTGIGMSASAGANAANNIGANIVGAGNSRASAYLTGAQGVNSAIQSGVGNYYLQDYLRKAPTGTPGYGDGVWA